MYSFDPILLSFVKGNLITLGVVLAFFKGLAKLSPDNTDDSVVQLFSDMLNTLNPFKKRKE